MHYNMHMLAHNSQFINSDTNYRQAENYSNTGPIVV